MTVYADILILTNFVADYFLILLACRFLHKKPRLRRLLLSSALGGMFSLYIFLPQSNFVFQIAVQIIMSIALCFVAFGYDGVKSFLRSVAVLFCVNFAYSGAMIAIWLMFKPYGMVINNSVVYFNISPLFLILFSVIGYFAAMLIKKAVKKPFLSSAYCTVRLLCQNTTVEVVGVLDTGNSLSDVFGLSEIFVTDIDTVQKVMEKEIENPTRFRKIPCSTVSGKRLLDGYRIDSAQITYNNRKYSFKNPVLAVSATEMHDAKVIVNPEKLN